MSRLTRKQRLSIECALEYLKRGVRYLLSERIAIARRGGPATTTLHYTRGDGAVLYEVEKQIGSELCLLFRAQQELERLLRPPEAQP